MAENLKFGDRLFLKGQKVLFDNGEDDAIIESRNNTLIIGDTDGTEHNVIINGNLTVEGTTTSVNTEQTTVNDPFMLITSLIGDKAGIEVDRDGETNAQFGWNELEDRWETFETSKFFSSDIESVTINVTDINASGTITGDIVSSQVDITGGNIDGTVIGATTPVQSYFTTITGDGTNITNVLTNYTTTDLAEGDNLYYTDERVDDRINNLFDASYGINANYTDTSNIFELSIDAVNIGTGYEILDVSNTTQIALRTLTPGANNDLTISVDNSEIVIDTAVKINNLEFNTFTGNGAVSQYTLPYSVSQDWQVLLYIDGVVQEPTTSYSVLGTDITLTAPLPNGAVMNVIKMASNTIASSITDANTLNAQPGSYYLDYTNFTNTPTNYMVTDADNNVSGSQIPSADATYDLGTETHQWNTIYGRTVEATYADLAERYAADASYEPGTVLVLGGKKEVTTTKKIADPTVIGVVSTDPAYLMNSHAGDNTTHPAIALKGRVPCKVTGPVDKGAMIVTSLVEGHGMASHGAPKIGTVIGKAITSKTSIGEGVVEILVSMM